MQQIQTNKDLREKELSSTMNAFHFKQFSIRHELCAMKVGTDGVLLGAWADCIHTFNILDVGTGSGILAMMAAQRNPNAMITAIDIEPMAVEQARINAEASLWHNRIHVEQADIRQWPSEETFDCILCNPPFYSNGMLSPQAQRNQARQTSCLSFEDLIASCAKRLSEEGSFHVIIPAESADHFIQTCWENDLFLKRKVWVFTKENKPSKRILLEFSHTRGDFPLSEKLILKDAENEPTDEYKKLTGDFYLNY